MSGNHFNRGLGVELLEIHDYHDDFPYLPEQFLLNFCRKL
jgi:hypothetical protein